MNIEKIKDFKNNLDMLIKVSTNQELNSLYEEVRSFTKSNEAKLSKEDYFLAVEFVQALSLKITVLESGTVLDFSKFKRKNHLRLVEDN